MLPSLLTSEIHDQFVRCQRPFPPLMPILLLQPLNWHKRRLPSDINETGVLGKNTLQPPHSQKCSAILLFWNTAKGCSSDSSWNCTVKIMLSVQLRFRKWSRYGSDAVSWMQKRLDGCDRGRIGLEADFPGKKISKVMSRPVDEDF